MNEKSPSGPPVRLILGGAITAIGIGMLLYFLVFAPDNSSDPDDPDNNAAMSNEDRLAFIRQVRRANAALENEHETTLFVDGKPVSGYTFAEENYADLRQKLPDELLPVVNTAISYYLYTTKTRFEFDDEGMAARDAAIERTAKALKDWHEREPESAAVHWLTANLEHFRLNRVNQEILDSFLKAAQLDPSNPGYHMEVYRACAISRDDSKSDIGSQALVRAYELAPKNIVVVLEYVKWLAETESEELADLLVELDSDIRSIANQNDVDTQNKDPLFRLEELKASVEDGDWGNASINARMLFNVMKESASYQVDRRPVEPEPLELMKHSLSDDFLSKVIEVQSKESEPIGITFDFDDPMATIDSDSTIRDVQYADFDLDVTLELVVLSDTELSVYKSSENGATWDRIAKYDLTGAYTGILVADLDRDNQGESAAEEPRDPNEPRPPVDPTKFDKVDVDFLLWGPDGLLALRNDLDRASDTRNIVAMPQEESVTSIQGITSAALIDFEADADLDIVAANEDGIHLIMHIGYSLEPKPILYRAHTMHSEIPAPASPIESMVVVDWDRDVDTDVVVADRDGRSVGVLENMRHGRFRWSPIEQSLPDASVAAPIAVLEADGNASWDLVGKTDEAWQVNLTSTVRAHSTQPLRHTTAVHQHAEGLLVIDYDNSGREDLIGWDSEGVQAYRGRMDGSFVEDSECFKSQLTGVTAVRSGDLDDDGDLDLICVTDKQVVIVANDGGNANHWITIRAIGAEDNAGRSNHSGIGSMIELRAGFDYQAKQIALQRTHFGLGERERPDVARSIWTNGMPQGIIQFEPDTVILQEMYLKGSCPFVYTWTGEKYEFFTDCLWAAPLGLQQSEGVLAPSRSWEYLHIPGDRLAKIDNEYRIQLTEELWEAAYFDLVELICVDRPADVEIFSNEKVGPPDIAQYRVLTVSNKRKPVSAIDQNGRDVLDQVLEADEVYLRAFDRKHRQGLVDPHHLELNLGDVDRSQEIMLFLTGWIHPTDTSLNIGFSQHPEVDPPSLPELWIADGQGGWQPLDRPMGFPGGKTKTIAVDLTDQFPSDDIRVQIRTSAEIYWDAAFFTVGEPDVPVQTTTLPATFADLHYRGFSRRLPRQPNGPELFDYSQVETEPQWPPMRGNFTRYGDVVELLHEEDDQMVILASGDEMTVHFAATLDDPPPGWKRDFFLHSIGWDKDADLNTIYGQTVEPLPHQNMNSYPYGLEDDYPDTEEHRAYLRSYQTRQSSFGAFWGLIRNLPVEPQEER